MPDTRSTTEGMASIQQSIADLSKMIDQMLKYQEEKKARQARMYENLVQIQSSVDELLPASARAGKQSVREFDNPPLLATPPGFVSHGFSDQPLQIHKSELIVAASCEEVEKSELVVDEYPKEGHDSLEVNTIADQSVVGDSAQTQVTFNHLPSEVSLDFVLSKFEVDDWKETQGFAKSVYAPSCYISKCSPTVCENASVYLPSFSLAHETFNGNWCSIQLFYMAAVCLNPPWEPPDDRTRHELKLMSLPMSENDGIENISRVGKWKEAMSLLAKMQMSGVSPDVITYNSLIYGFSVNGKWEEEYKTWMIEAIDEDDDFVRISYLKGVELDELIGKVTISISFVPALGGYAFKDGYLSSPLDLSLMKEMSSILSSENVFKIGGYMKEREMSDIVFCLKDELYPEDVRNLKPKLHLLVALISLCATERSLSSEVLVRCDKVMPIPELVDADTKKVISKAISEHFHINGSIVDVGLELKLCSSIFSPGSKSVAMETSDFRIKGVQQYAPEILILTLLPPAKPPDDFCPDSELLSDKFLAAGLTTVTPTHFVVPNIDGRDGDHSVRYEAYRPSLAVVTNDLKYDYKSMQGYVRSSAKEIIGRVTTGTCASTKNILKLYSWSGALAFASQIYKSVLAEMKRNEIFPNVVTYSSLIDGLCKGGEFEKVKGVLCKMKDSGIIPNVMTYCSMISGLCDAGSWKEAKTKKGVAITIESMLKIDTLDDYVAELEKGVHGLFESFARIYLLNSSVGQTAGMVGDPLLSTDAAWDLVDHSSALRHGNDGIILMVWVEKPPPLPPEIERGYRGCSGPTSMISIHAYWLESELHASRDFGMIALDASEILLEILGLYYVTHV